MEAVEASSETHFDVAEQCTINPCIRACIELAGERVRALRYLTSVTRGRDEICVGDWILLTTTNELMPPAIACVSLLMEVHLLDNQAVASTAVRIWCDKHVVLSQVTTCSDTDIWLRYLCASG